MADPLIIIDGPEQSRVDPTLPDAGLPPAVGVESYQVFRASRDVPDITDSRGWTYHHHVDMACWRGRLYVGWNSCERDEDVWPSRELYSTSTDGRTWSAPEEMFPQGVSTPLRMYFFRAPPPLDRMLVIAGMRVDTTDTSEDRKWPLVVREILQDHTLGEAFALQGRHDKLPAFAQSRDAGFVAACNALLADRVFLEQQDRGKLLGNRRMKWHDAAAWPAGSVPGDSEKWVAGKAYSFFRRPDGAIVGVSKMGWATLSTDNGETWSQPLVPPTLVTGKAKVWSQRTGDGRYALVYNPSRKNRFPLAIVTGEDGMTFRDMRIVQGELPVQRYAGMHRSIGPQYVRGISHWANDGSRDGIDSNLLWLVYSMNKEDIWVSRVPLDARPPAWNIYSPLWAPVTIAGDGDDDVRLEDRDPYDYASATRVFEEQRDATITMEILAEQPRAALHVEIIGPTPPIRMAVMPTVAREWKPMRVTADVLQRITFRTAEPRGIGGANPVASGTDRPHAPVTFRIRNLRVTGLESSRLSS